MKRKLDYSRVEIDTIKFFKHRCKGITIKWSSPDIGFGEYTLYKKLEENSKWKADSEYMDWKDDTLFGQTLFEYLIEHVKVKTRGGTKMKKDLDLTDLKIVDIDCYVDEEDREEGMIITWQSPTLGSGEYNFYKNIDSDKWMIDSEFIDDNNDKQFGKELLMKFLEMCEIE